MYLDDDSEAFVTTSMLAANASYCLSPEGASLAGAFANKRMRRVENEACQINTYMSKRLG